MESIATTAPSCGLRGALKSPGVMGGKVPWLPVDLHHHHVAVGLPGSTLLDLEGRMVARFWAANINFKTKPVEP